MQKFLQQIAETYWTNAGDGVGEMCFVFPNRRSATFFNHYLGLAARKPVFAPKLVTINDFFAELSGLDKVDQISSLYRLYRHYSELMWPGQDPKESFDQFIYWGDILLSDFDDIDKYLADARLLFANIHDLNEIGAEYTEYLSERQIAAIREFWRNFLSSGPDSTKIQSFRSTWSILFQLYSDFKEELAAEGLGYEGMIYRKVADSIRDENTRDSVVEKLNGYRKIVFVGLNALNECEKTLLDLIRDRLEGDFYWDFEDGRTRDSANKSSFFIRENIIRYPSAYTLKPSLPQAQSFRTFAVPSSTGQTRVANELLKELCSKPDFDPMDTAIVLPDEKLLMPMLGAIPEEIGGINVTMGFPLSASNASTFVRFLENLHRNRRTTREGICTFYHRDVVNLLNHPYLADDEKTDETVSEIVSKNIIYPEAKFLASKNELWSRTFVELKEAEQVYRYLLELIDGVNEKVSGVDMEFLFHLRKSVQRLESLHIPMQLDTCFSLIEQLVSGVTVPFEGEPLHGLQVMGPLETRALDFKNIIILSMTEGVFPKRSISGSFIPYNIRLGFGLPNYEFQDALSSYYFYRSIARAENICFIYDSTTGGLQSGEASRFIKQLKYHFGVELNQRAVSFPLLVDAAMEKGAPVVRKTPEIMAKLCDKFLRGEKPKAFSASSLNKYIDCPLAFYYQYVEGIAESEEVTEELDSALFGSIFHRTIELIYQPHIGKTLTSKDILAMAADVEGIEKLISQAFLDEINIRNLSGRNMIVKQLILRFVTEILNFDADCAPLTVVGTEKGLPAELSLDDGTRVRLYGVIDRVDRRADGKLHIIDYKTGTIDGKVEYKQIEDIFSQSDKRPSITLQLFLYAYLALENGLVKVPEECSPTVYALRTIFSKKIAAPPVLSKELEIWKRCLKNLITEIFDPEVPFMATGKEKMCEWCDFKIICGR